MGEQKTTTLLYGHTEVDNRVTDKQIYQEISISPLDKGFVLRIGCQSLAVTNPNALLKMLEIYLKDPNGAKDNYYTGVFDNFWN